MSNGLLLWVDDEIELLKAHIIFLEKKGYKVVTVSNGPDAIDLCRQQTYDLILLDEMMPGLSGLETLQQIKEIQPATPIVMCTDCRLSHQACQPQPNTLVAQEEHPSQGHRYRSNPKWIPTRLSADSPANSKLPHDPRLDGSI